MGRDWLKASGSAGAAPEHDQEGGSRFGELQGKKMLLAAELGRALAMVPAARNVSFVFKLW